MTEIEGSCSLSPPNLSQPRGDTCRPSPEASLAEALSIVFAAAQATQRNKLSLLQEIARAAKLISAADLIIVYEYFGEIDDVTVPPAIAGEVCDRFVLQGKGIAKSHRASVVFELLRRGESFYARRSPEDWAQAGLLSGSTIREESFFTREGIISSAGIPLQTDDEKTGLLFINYRQERNFGPELRESLEVFARQAALAISSVRSSLRAERYRKNLEVLNRIGHELNSAIDWDIEQIGQLIDEQIHSVLPAPNFFICLYEEEKNQLALAYIRDEHNTAETLEPTLSEGLTAYVCRSGKPLLVNRASQEKLYAENLAQCVGRPAAVWLGAPLLIRDRVIGALVIQDYTDETSLSLEHLDLLTAIASQAAVAINRVQLLRDREMTRQGLLVTANAVAVGQIATSFIHEAKNSLNGMSLTIFNLREDIESESELKAGKDYVERLSVVLSEMERLDDLSRRLQRFSQQRLSPQKRESLVNEIVANTLRLLDSVLRKKGMRFEVRLDSTLDVAVRADESQIQQVLMNLILNAVAASRERGLILVETDRCDEYVEIRITDYGLGISEETKRKLFTPFFTTKADGVGLGLYLSKLLIEDNHDGNIEILATAPGRGTTFAIRIPVQAVGRA